MRGLKTPEQRKACRTLCSVPSCRLVGDHQLLMVSRTPFHVQVSVLEFNTWAQSPLCPPHPLLLHCEDEVQTLAELRALIFSHNKGAGASLLSSSIPLL